MNSANGSQLTILLDADDTLWENNVHFERAIAAFISFLDHTTHTPDETRQRLNAIERRTIAERGYGTESFRISLVRCFEEISQNPPTGSQHTSIMRFVDAVVSAEVELIGGVEQALVLLANDHRLILMTKGNRLEQLEKLERSGLATLFTAAEVVPEKTAAAYGDVGRSYGCDPRRTWMVGNSPRSDINPALEAGFHAAFIPHPATWVLEQDELQEPPAGQHLLILTRLDELLPAFETLARTSPATP